ncbi:MAG: glycosyltransferase family 9 protein [Gammaproteobacteria bacterium]|nr:glycosyltransferase family 9 protein [Gammaproteobacteria bacterium]
MLSYPVFALLKAYLPEVELHALVSRYTQPMADICSYIDQVKVDPGAKCGFANFIKFSSEIRKEHYDAVITLFSTTRIGFLLVISNIPYRLAPATKIAQIFYNHRLRQRRSSSEKPEYVYNLELAKKLLNELGLEVTSLPSTPFLQFPAREINNLRESFCSTHDLPADCKLIFMHPGSGGSANNLPLSSYSELAHSITSARPWKLVISAGPDDVQQAESLLKLTSDLEPVIYYSSTGLVNFARHLAFADLFISGSTGPLHIAGALDIPTAAFYTRRRSATSTRWQTLNSPSRRLSFTPPAKAAAEDMHSIDVKEAGRVISEKYLLE